MKRLLPVLAIAGLVLSGCGEAGMLDGVGNRTRDAVHGDTTTTVTAAISAVDIGSEGLVETGDVLWFNDDIDPQFTGASQEVIAAIWRRQLNSRFVQSSRSEIAAAIPAITFPGLVPNQVRWITSQLVFNETSGTLDSDTSVAYGMWMADPYQSDTDRLAVMRVGRAPIEAPGARSEVIVVAVPDGVSLGWTESGQRFELFCRTELSEELCLEVAESSVPLVDLLP